MVVWTGILQGLGLGLVFVPLSTVAFATLDLKYRTEATALFSLVRNIGSSIGISIVSLFLARNLQVNHSELAGALTPYSMQLQQLPPRFSDNAAGLQMLDAMVNQQALMISYNNDFKLMMLITLAAIPLAIMLRKPPAARPVMAGASAE